MYIRTHITYYFANYNYTFDVFSITGVLRNLIAELGVKQLSTNTKPMSLTISKKYCCKLACNISYMDAMLTCQWLKHATMSFDDFE